MNVRDGLLVRVGGHRAAWVFRRRMQAAGFKLSRGRFGLAYKIGEASARGRALPDLIRNAVAPVLLAISLVVAIRYADPSARSAARWLSWPAPNASSYDVLLEAVAGVTGVFLALYFTAVSTVAASVYVNVPHDIRALIVRDRLGGIYVIGTAFTTALSVTLLIAHTLTSDTYELAPPVVGVFTAFSIFSFIKLGQRAFYLADPTRLGGTIALDFASWFNRATPAGWRWRDPSFQEHYRSRASQAVTSLKSLIAIADDQPHLRGSSVRQLCMQVSGLLAVYIGRRDEVPTKSRWFGERYEHKQWYLASSTELDMATATATQLQPNVVPDVRWVENELLPALTGVVMQAVRNGDLEEAFQVLSRLEPIFAAMGRRWDVLPAKTHIDDLTSGVITRLLERPDASEIGKTAAAVAVFDSLAMLPMAVELGLHRYVMETPAPQDRVPKINDLAKAAAPYRHDLPRAVVETVEQIQAARTFERMVAASAATRTPDWYLDEIARNSYETDFKKQVLGAIDHLATWYPATATRLADAGLAGPLGAVVERGLETCWKLGRHVHEWQNIAESVRPDPVLVDIVRPEWDWESAHQRVRNLRRDLLHRLTNIVGMQAFDHRDPALPDYLGGAVHWMGETCIEALIENDPSLFSDLYPTYFVGVLLVVDRIQDQVTTWQPMQAVAAVTEPMIDLLELSGLVFIFSELHQEWSMWDACRARWDAYLDAPDGANRMRWIASVHLHHRTQFAITHRATLRTRWEMATSHVLAALPRDNPAEWYDEGEVRHPSPIIRRIAPKPHDLGSPFEASDIFVEMYLAQQPDAVGLDFGVADWVGQALRENVEAEDEAESAPDDFDEGQS